MRDLTEVIHAFTPAGKLDQGTDMRMRKITTAAKDFATEIVDLVPECADRTAALRKLLEVKMTCVQAITHCMTPTKTMDQPPTAGAKKKRDTTQDN